jgi:hypothetical protein
MFCYARKIVTGAAMLAVSLSPAVAQDIVEDTASAGPSATAATTMTNEASRSVDIPPVFAQLKSKAAGGTAAFFVAAGVDITSSLILLSNPPKSPDDLLPYQIVTLGVGACIMSSVPATCAQASGAVDAFSESYGYAPPNPVWKLYGGGWGCYGLGTVLNLVGTYGQSPEVALTGSIIAFGGSILWGIACVKSIVLINELGEKAGGKSDDGGLSFSVTPLLGPKGTVGAAVSGHF